MLLEQPTSKTKYNMSALQLRDFSIAIQISNSRGTPDFHIRLSLNHAVVLAYTVLFLLYSPKAAGAYLHVAISLMINREKTP